MEEVTVTAATCRRKCDNAYQAVPRSGLDHRRSTRQARPKRKSVGQDPISPADEKAIIECIAPQAKFYVGCRPTAGRLLLRVIQLDTIFVTAHTAGSSSIDLLLLHKEEKFYLHSRDFLASLYAYGSSARAIYP
ncbi:hypothetical protein EV127DRAFT_408142 [Xylaria flabelliformis]|nr:hypothetical protein EV127DRAFT_408142 [Xylaria flabelliformis]